MEKNILKLDTQFELIGDAGETSQLDFLPTTAISEISLNPQFQWAKIVITDDAPNGNKMVIPQDEFDNIVKTGIFAPIKMSFGKPTTHAEALRKPIGVIAQIIKEANKLIALAAFWKTERAEDVSLLKEMYINGTPPQVSWEVSYRREDEVDGNKILRDTCLDGLAIVQNPAYKGRTPFIAVSSLDDKNPEPNLEVNVEELEQLKTKVAEQLKEIETLKASLVEKDTLLAKRDTDLAELAEYKEKAEKAKAEADKLIGIKTKFKDAGLEKEDTYFEENKDKFLSMPDNALDFMLQEMISFGKATSEQKNDGKTKVPPIKNTNDKLDLSDPKALAKALRERNPK